MAEREFPGGQVIEKLTPIEAVIAVNSGDIFRRYGQAVTADVCQRLSECHAVGALYQEIAYRMPKTIESVFSAAVDECERAEDLGLRLTRKQRELRIQKSMAAEGFNSPHPDGWEAFGRVVGCYVPGDTGYATLVQEDMRQEQLFLSEGVSMADFEGFLTEGMSAEFIKFLAGFHDADDVGDGPAVF